jgi:hypothetical protein
MLALSMLGALTATAIVGNEASDEPDEKLLCDTGALKIDVRREAGNQEIRSVDKS